VYIGFLVAAYIITPLLYWGDLFHTKRFPIITNKLFLSNGHRYNVSEVKYESICIYLERERDIKHVLYGGRRASRYL
jgi:hypothetical protein